MELLVVIAIIGILAVVAVPSLIKNIDKAKIAEVKSDVNAIELSVKSFYLNHGRWPCTQVHDGNNENYEEDIKEIFSNIDSTKPSNNSEVSYPKSPFEGDYRIDCVHRGSDSANPIEGIYIGGFTVSNTVRNMIEDDEYFRNHMNIKFTGDNNTVWMYMDVKE